MVSSLSIAMNKDAKIYVAGHRGLVGSAITRKLEKEGYSNLVMRSSAKLNLCEQSAVNEFFEAEKPEYVFLAAAKVGGILANDSYPGDFLRENLQIQTNVIDAAWRNGAKKLLFLGSSCIYPKLAPQPLKEEYLLTGPLEPTNEWYAIAKIAGIKMCQAYRRQYGFNAISLMPTNLYGPNDNFDLQNSHVLPALIRKFHLAKLAAANDVDGLARDEQRCGEIPVDVLDSLGLTRIGQGFERKDIEPKVALWGSGSPRREFLHVDDLGNACVYFMNNFDGEQFLNVGVGEDSSIRELADLVRRTVEFEGEVLWDASMPDGTPRKLMDVQAANHAGWEASIGLAQGINQVYQSYCETEILEREN